MTLVNRNILIKLTLCFLLLFSVFITVVCFLLLTSEQKKLSLYTEKTQFVENYIGGFSLIKENENLFVIQNMLYPIYAFCILLAIYFLFEKTYVTEISFFIFFAIFLSFESLKILVPFFNLWTLSPKIVLTISKILYFFRYASILLFLSTGIFIITPFTRRITPVIFSILFLSLAITSLTPFNNTILKSNFLVQNGFQNLTAFSFVFFSFFVVTSYFVAAKTLNAFEYNLAAWSVLFLIIGWLCSLNATNLILFIFANISFVSGTIFYLRSIHSYNLWQ